MASYTIELRKVAKLLGENTVKSWFMDYKLTDYLTPSEIETIEKHNTWTQAKLANAIYNAYYMKEIGFETPNLFRHFVKARMNEIMERYLPLIYTASLEYDLLTNENYTETYDRNYKDNKDTQGKLNRNITTTTNNTTQTNESQNQNANGLTINSDTPQGEISKQNILNGTYASSTSAGESEQTIKTENKGTQKGEEQINGQDINTLNENGNGNENYKRHVEGNRGIDSTYQKLIKQYRENIVGINEEIIRELKDLFFGLY